MHCPRYFLLQFKNVQLEVLLLKYYLQTSVSSWITVSDRVQPNDSRFLWLLNSKYPNSSSNTSGHQLTPGCRLLLLAVLQWSRLGFGYTSSWKSIKSLPNVQRPLQLDHKDTAPQLSTHSKLLAFDSQVRYRHKRGQHLHSSFRGKKGSSLKHREPINKLIKECHLFLATCNYSLALIWADIS